MKPHEKLKEACRSSDLAELKRLETKGVYVSWSNYCFPVNYLEYACLDVLKYYFEKGFEIIWSNGDISNIRHSFARMCEKGKLDCIRYLIEEQRYDYHENNYSAFLGACYEKSYDVVGYFVNELEVELDDFIPNLNCPEEVIEDLERHILADKLKRI